MDAIASSYENVHKRSPTWSVSLFFFVAFWTPHRDLSCPLVWAVSTLLFILLQPSQSCFPTSPILTIFVRSSDQFFFPHNHAFPFLALACPNIRYYQVLIRLFSFRAEHRALLHMKILHLPHSVNSRGPPWVNRLLHSGAHIADSPKASTISFSSASLAAHASPVRSAAQPPPYP
jgi:hypothetical protein